MLKKFLLLLPCAIGIGLGACSPGPQGPAHVSLAVLSNKPYLLSGGNALLEVTASTADGDDITLLVNGIARNVDLAAVGQDGELTLFRGLITGLNEGNNSVTARLGDAAAELPVVNYPISGPIFSGPHQQPYFCLGQLAPDDDGNPRRFAIGNGDYLDASVTDGNCTLPGRVDYLYRSNGDDPQFLPLADTRNLPADLAYVTTSEGVEVPYIVRLETGTINRAIYQIAVLHDPRQPAPSPLGSPGAWNQRLVYTFGGGCEAGYFQGTGTGDVLRDTMLRRGYAVASSTLNVNSQGGCNDVLSAETLMMVKEHFIESYGVPRYTIGRGSSGGAMQQFLIAGAYPGLLDGLLPSNTFADAVTYFTDSQECAGILRDYVNDPALGLSDASKNAIGGWSMWSLCETSLGDRPKRIAPDDCPAQIPAEARYDAVDNPAGVRCSIYDGMRNIFGEKRYPAITDQRAFARAPHDNVGVQYGLAALNSGLIDTALFLDLNENIGGWDIDVNARRQRTVADDDALRIAYQTGRVSSGGAGLAQVPIIDDRSYLDDIGNFHASVYSFITRARLERDNGHAENYILRRHSRDLSLEDENLELMDRWLASIQADRSTDRLLDKIVRARPAELQNDCFAANGERIAEDPVFNPGSLYDNTEGSCNRLFPPHAGLRLVAGGPLSNDILKCQLKPIDYGDYTVSFSDQEKARLEAIFPDGVCDWSKPGVHQQVNSTWLSFGPSPVNRYEP
ncbi:MAG: DUF6351 family protein [Gammaproteobacteria bacterium]|nr:hypothetical protein [Pseudomonadales bacterium]MCP5348300.1 hypothetical protein [Pseudomonadales bacterium]